MTKRMVIVTGGTLGPWAEQELRKDDVLIGADKGALHLVRLGLQPDYSVGDFDSVSSAELEEIRSRSKEIMIYDPVDKDWTDTEMAFNWAISQNPSEITLLGALGSRWDHSLSNIHLLRKGLDSGVPCKIIDANNEIMLINGAVSVWRSRFTNISLLPLSMEVTGITLRGFQYPLINAALRIGESLGISNVLIEDQGYIEVETGYLLVIQSKDDDPASLSDN